MSRVCVCFSALDLHSTLRCENIEVLLAAHSISQKEPLNDSPSETHDRRHAGAESFAAHTDFLRATVSLFARHFNKSPEVLGAEQICTYQVYLTNEKKLAPGSILIAVAALRFLYKVSLKRG